MVTTAKQSAPFALTLGGVMRAGADVWRERVILPTDRWVEQNIRIPGESSAAPGRFDLVARPYWREPLAELDNPEVATITLMADAQAGKTTFLCAALASRTELDPAPSMLLAPDKDAMLELRDKVFGMCEETPALANRLPPPSRRNDRSIDFGNMLCYLAYTGNPQRMRARPCKYVFCTEVQVYRDDPKLGSSAQVVQARVKSFIEYKIVFESTPGEDGTGIDFLFARSDRRRNQVPCPHCNDFQELRFFPHKEGPFAGKGGVAGLTDEKGDWLTPEQALGEAYYVCRRGCRIDSFQKGEMVEGGIWVKAGQSVKNGKPTGRPTRGPRDAGFQISTLYHPDKTFGDVAAAYLDHREKRQLRAFFNNWLGLANSSATALPHWKKLGQNLAWHHRRGTVPGEAYFLTSDSDVQLDRSYCGIRAWGPKRTSWLVDFECFPRGDSTTPKDHSDGIVAPDLAQVEVFSLLSSFPIAGGGANPLGQNQLKTRLLGIDTNYRMFDVHDFVRAMRQRHGDRVRAVRGDESVGRDQLFRSTNVEQNQRTGKPYPGGLQLWGIYVNAFREQLVELFSASPTQPGAWLLTADVVQTLENYLRQLVNQPPVKEILPSGKEVTLWKTRDKAVGEHAWDIEVIQLALAHMVTGGDWDLEKLVSKQTAKPPAGAGEPEIVLPRNFDAGGFSAR